MHPVLGPHLAFLVFLHVPAAFTFTLVHGPRSSRSGRGSLLPPSTRGASRGSGGAPSSSWSSDEAARDHAPAMLRARGTALNLIGLAGLGALIYLMVARPG